MHGLKLSFMTSSLKSGYHKWMPHYILALAFSIASQTLELSPIVPQKSAYFCGFFFQYYRYFYSRFQSNPKNL